MPNWCENDLAVEGPTEVIGEFLKFAAGESPFDFGKFIPYPDKFQRQDEIAEAWLKEHAERPDYDWRLQPKDGFNSGGYDWCVANWGTKWPASRVEVEGPMTGYDEKTVEVVFHFDTAWSPPKPVIKKAAELYPAMGSNSATSSAAAVSTGSFVAAGAVESNKCGAYFGTRGG